MKHSMSSFIVLRVCIYAHGLVRTVNRVVKFEARPMAHFRQAAKKETFPTLACWPSSFGNATDNLFDLAAAEKLSVACFKCCCVECGNLKHSCFRRSVSGTAVSVGRGRFK